MPNVPRNELTNVEPDANGNLSRSNQLLCAGIKGSTKTTKHGSAGAKVPELARESDLIGAIQRDIAVVGLVGEQDIALLVYLAYSSRRLKKPLSVIIKGPSGSGKDEVQRRPAELMPPEDVLDCMSVTPQALFHSKAGWLKHKILIGGERKHEDDDAQRDRTAAVRQMLSHGYITKLTVTEGKTVKIRQDGPISYSETTTKDSIFNEDANRCLQVDTNASIELTKMVLKAQGQRYEPGPDAVNDNVVKAKNRHWEFQRALSYVDVRIPFASTLSDKMPAYKIEVRRLFSHVLSLIEVIAFLHQHCRARNTFGQLEATVDDYAVARRLVLGPLHTAIGLVTDHARYIEFEKRLPKGEFDSNKAMNEMKTSSRKVTHDVLKKLAAMGVVQCVAKSEGNKPARWRRTGRTIDELILPSIATIRAATVTALPKPKNGK